MSEYAAIVADLIHKTRAREAVLELRDDLCCSRFLLHDRPTDKVILFFHGFTAVPQQFVPIGEAFFQAGYNVLIPLLPGHGQAGNWSSDKPPPLPETQSLYQEFGLNWLEHARALGDQVVIGGLSGGSTLCAWMALERPQEIYRCLLFAPYLSGTNKAVDLVVQWFDFYFKWHTLPGAVSFGYEGFYMPALRVFLEMGQDVLDRAKTTPAAPMLIISSASDSAVGSHEHQTLFESALTWQPKCWYHCFDDRFHIQHNMMTKAEGNRHRDLVIAIAKAYVDSDITWSEVKFLRERLHQGILLEDAIAQLHLQLRVTSDIAAVVTTSNGFCGKPSQE